MLLKSICLLALIIALCILTVFRERFRHARLAFTVLTVLYLVILLWFTVIRNENNQTINSFIPFSSYWRIAQVRWYGNGEYIFRGIVGNVLLFVPIGILISDINGVRYPFVMSGIAGFIVSSMIELIQYINALGAFEADDIISNTWGALIGCSIAAIILSIRKGKRVRILSVLIPLITFVGLMAAMCVVPIFKEILLFIKQG